MRTLNLTTHVREHAEQYCGDHDQHSRPPEDELDSAGNSRRPGSLTFRIRHSETFAVWMTTVPDDYFDDFASIRQVCLRTSGLTLPLQPCHAGPMPISYLHLPPGQEPPDIGPKRAYRAVVVVEQDTSPEWRAKVSDWLVQTGCLYMMAWGQDSSAWDDSVDWANLLALGGPEALDGKEIPDDDFVITTWHDNEPLSETFLFSEHTARHPTIPINETIIVDVGEMERGNDLLEMLKAAQQRTE